MIHHTIIRVLLVFYSHWLLRNAFTGLKEVND